MIDFTDAEFQILIDAMHQLEYHKRGKLSPEELALFHKLKSRGKT